MKRLHKPNLYCWSEFNTDRNIDFHSYVWVRDAGSVVFDPLSLSDHDREHLLSLGSVSHIIISNSDHVREASTLAELTGAVVWGPAGEKEEFPISCSKWLEAENSNEVDCTLDGLQIFCLNGSKSPGELAFVIEEDTLITGDLIRAHQGGNLCLLPDPKLKNKTAAIESIQQLVASISVEAVLPGDGWPVFRNGQKVLTELVKSLL